MPTYEYECKICGHRFEIFQSMSDAPEKKCPKCNGKVRKLFSGGTGLIFKGSGFYSTDNRQKSEVRTRCGNIKTCCGKDIPCNTPPCEK